MYPNRELNAALFRGQVLKSAKLALCVRSCLSSSVFMSLSPADVQAYMKSTGGYPT